MRLGLDELIDAVSDILDEGCQLAERAVLLNSHDRNASTSKICHQHKLPGLVHRDEACAGAAGRDGVQKTKLASGRINRKCAHIGRVIERRPHRIRVFAHRVKKAMVGRDR